jgi:hypothetical protein
METTTTGKHFGFEIIALKQPSEAGVTIYGSPCKLRKLHEVALI